MTFQEVKGKSKKAQRYLDKRKPLVVENVKVAMFIKGHKTSQIINNVLNDMISLKKPDAQRFFKKEKNGQKGPFEDVSDVEYFSSKVDASLFMYGSHSKKRPHHLVIGRLFDYHLLDMMELGISEFKSMADFEYSKLPMLGSKPCFTVVGPEFHTNPNYEMAANLIVDFFRGRIIEKISLVGIDHVISLSVGPRGVIQFRHYYIHMKKSGTRIPRVELEEVGPALDFTIGRTRFGEESLRKQSLRKPKELTAKKQKNVTTTAMRDKVANVHVPKQNIEQIEKNAIKPKALKRSHKLPQKRKREDGEKTPEQPAKKQKS